MSSTSLKIAVGAVLDSSIGTVFNRLKRSSAELGKTLKQATLKASVAGNVDKYQKRLKSLRIEQIKLGGSSEKLNIEVKETERKYEAARRAARRLGVDTRNAAESQREFAKQAQRAQRALDAQERKARRKQHWGKTVAGVGSVVGLGYAAARPFRNSLDDDLAAVRLKRVLVSNDKETDLAEARKSARTHVQRFGTTSEADLLGIQYGLNSAGIDAATARVGSTVVANVATVTDGAPEAVSEVIATVFNNLGSSIEGSATEQMTRIGDLLTKTQFKFQIRDFGQLGESLKYATPSLKQYNVNLEQGLTLIGALNSSGLQGSMAGTALAATMRKMAAASDEFGFDLERGADGQLDFIKTLENLSDAVGGFDNMDIETSTELQKIFGDEGIKGVILLGTKLEELKRAQDDVANGSTGVVDASMNEYMNSTSGIVAKFTTNMRELGTVLIDTFLPVLNEYLPKLTAYASGLGAVIESTPALGKSVANIVGTVAAVGAGALGLIAVFKVLAVVGAAVKSVIKGVVFVAKMTPLGRLISLLVFSAGYIVAKWDSVLVIFEKIKSVWQSVVDTFNQKVEIFKKGAAATMIGKAWSAMFSDDDEPGRSGSTVAAAVPASVGTTNNRSEVKIENTINIAGGESGNVADNLLDMMEGWWREKTTELNFGGQ